MDRNYALYGVLSLLLLVGFVGCSLASRSLDYVEVCKGDAECVAQVRDVGNFSADLVHKVLDPLPVASGVANVIAICAGLLGSAIAGVVLGRKLKQRG